MFSGANLPRVGTYNLNVVLGAIQASKRTSRAEIAQQTGLTAQTVSVIVRRLIEQGIVGEGGSLPSKGGKPRKALHIIPSAANAVGIHFDPLGVSIVVVDLLGQPLARSHQDISPGLDPEALIAQAARTALSLLSDLGVPPDRVLGVGAACPGPIDQSQGLVTSPPRRDRWTEVPIKRLLEHHIGFDVTIDNDANAAAIGERWSGHGRTVSDFAFLYLGTGIGAGLFLSNHIYRGRVAQRRRVRPRGGRAQRDPLLLRQPRLPGGDVQPGRHRQERPCRTGAGPGQQARHLSTRRTRRW